MFGERRISPLVKAYAADRGWPIISICQPQHLFRKDVERKHAHVAVQSDPWQATILTSVLGEARYGIGTNPDEAVLAAIPKGIMESIRRLTMELDNLHDCLQK